MSDWFASQRELWIDEMLRVYGFINREHLMRKFGVSRPQATHDLQRFLDTHPGRMQYDLTAKRYVCIDRTR